MKINKGKLEDATDELKTVDLILLDVAATFFGFYLGKMR
jgi:hypothetical protein